MLPYVLTTSGEHPPAGKIYQVGFTVPSHSFDFNAPWPEGGPAFIFSSTYQGWQGGSARLSGSPGTSISQVSSPISAGYGQALELKGGQLEMQQSITPLLKEGFTVSVWLQTTMTGSSDLSGGRVPALIGRYDPVSANDIYLFTIDSRGHIGIALGEQYGAMSSRPLNDGVMHHLTLTRTLTTTNEGTASTTQLYVDGRAEGAATTTLHKGHSGLPRNMESLAPDADLQGDITSIGRCTVNNDNQCPAFQGVIDNLEIRPFAVDASAVGEIASINLHLPLTTEFQPAGLAAAYALPGLQEGGSFWLSYTATSSSTAEHLNASELHCVGDENQIYTYQQDKAYQLDSINFSQLSQLQCRLTTSDSKITSIPCLLIAAKPTFAVENNQMSPCGQANLQGLRWI